MGEQRYKQWAQCSSAIPTLPPPTTDPTDQAAGAFTAMENVCLLLSSRKLLKNKKYKMLVSNRQLPHAKNYNHKFNPISILWLKMKHMLLLPAIKNRYFYHLRTNLCSQISQEQHYSQTTPDLPKSSIATLLGSRHLKCFCQVLTL